MPKERNNNSVILKAERSGAEGSPSSAGSGGAELSAKLPLPTAYPRILAIKRPTHSAKLHLALAVLAASLLAQGHLVAEPKPALRPASTFTIPFPEMPPTFRARMHPEQKEPAQMTVFLPGNYSADRKYPLLVFLNGGDGGNGSNPGVARALSEDKDFVCLSVPLFRTGDPTAQGNFIFHPADGPYMWPFFRTMLAKLDALVPNIDPAHQILGGFSNGAHATAALIDGSDGEITRRFSAFLFVEGGGHLEHYDQLAGKPVLMGASSQKSKPRADEIFNTAKTAGALGTFIFQDAGGHDFPKAAYPAVRDWLRGAAHVDVTAH